MSSVPSRSHAHPIVFQQDRYDKRRRFLRDFLLRRIGFVFLAHVRAEGTENIPASGPTLLIMNHIGSLDPFVVTGAVTSRYVVPMSKIENYENPVVGLMARSWGAYPVRRGEVDRQALDSTIELLRQERAVLIAPEGTRQHALSEPKDGMTYIGLKTGAVFVPIGLDGTDQFPYSYKRLRRPQVTVRFGQPFRLCADSTKRIPRDEMRQMTNEIMFRLAALLPESRRGAYHDLDQATTRYLEFVSADQ